MQRIQDARIRNRILWMPADNSKGTAAYLPHLFLSDNQLSIFPFLLPKSSESILLPLMSSIIKNAARLHSLFLVFFSLRRLDFRHIIRTEFQNFSA